MSDYRKTADIGKARKELNKWRLKAKAMDILDNACIGVILGSTGFIIGALYGMKYGEKVGFSLGQRDILEKYVIAKWGMK